MKLQHRAERRRRSRSLIGAGAGALLVSLLAFACVSGLALAHGLSTTAALLAAIGLVLLPTGGLASLLGAGRTARLCAATLWPLCLLVALPHYFPGEREHAVRTGLRWLAAPLGDEAAGSIAAAAARTLAVLGEDPVPLPPLAAAGEPEPDAVAEPQAAGAVAEADELSAGQADGTPGFRLAFEGDGSSLRLPVAIDGPDFGAQFTLLFDTGATFTTLDFAALEQLGVRIASDAPRVTLRTANGEIEASLALVDAVWLGGAVVQWVTVAACDSCAGPESAGLLGLNVSGQFRIALDHARRQIELHPRAASANRHLDVGPWLDLRSEAQRWWDGRVEVELSVHNRAAQAVESVVVEVDCGAAAFAVEIGSVDSRADSSSKVSLPRGTDCSHHRLGLRSARWRLDRL